MEVLLGVLVGAVVLLAVGVLTFAFLIIKVLNKQVTTTVEKTFEKEQLNNQDTYVPDDVNETVPLDQFTPDFSKPPPVVKYVSGTDEDGNQVLEERQVNA